MCASSFHPDVWTAGSALLLHRSSPEGKASRLSKSSAISISRDWVLTHGTVLDPIVNTSDAISKFISSITPGQLTEAPVEVAKQLEFSVLRELNATIEQHIGRVAYAWICPLLMETFDRFFSTWKFYERDMCRSPLQRVLFLLVRVDSDRPQKNPSTAEQALRYLHTQSSSRSFARGAPVEIVSSPFGNLWLINSMAQGIVSNLIGGVVITDAYVFPKSEGGPVYVVSPNSGNRTLVGMVIVTMTWCQNEWVHYTFAANLALCLSVVLQQKHRPLPSIKSTIRHDKPSALDRGVVMVTCGINKGTGVLVDKDTGTFLTCSHVIEEAPEMEISIVIFRGGRYSRVPAKLLFSNTEMLPYDVAVLRVEPSMLDPSLEPVQFSDAPIVQGEPVVAVGFALLLSTRPTVSCGIVSKSLDCMLMTTCCIQSGFSGGPIISRKTGRMLGMIASNVESMDSSVHYQRMSLSVPVAVLSKPLRQYLLTDNVDVLRSLVSDDPIVKKTWALEFRLPSKL
ncbi:PREDICTED: peroxisomal leader peptide-processing protease [Dinoponera quadriceps]|uniref:Peroxisomal leader peptide-processing protease n=1 Tax=Dinoponera quadriceps TaxID=609295 RepID=A0A6P3XWU7_DINQU|nr:PREDICTED: peroxisomal leader peptide-processing protease [Dinoponera quadriceps]XP_014482552.1 PREDICTED: peroxisomal leader peptide-processing protease [Dinoponera quadriceps]XP_014482553.1 PREDICTED: peroxisomal leader peptide-processing protease [Dinoponera quadriceps]